MLIASLLAVAAFGSDSTAVIESCKRPSAPLGVLEAQAAIAFHVDRQGRIAADSIRILSSKGASDAGVLSYLQRLLPACRVKLGRAFSRDDGIWFRQYVDLASAKAPRDSALHALDTAPLATPVEPPSPLTSAEPLLAGDSRIEERPRVIRCDRPPTVSETVRMPASSINQAVATRTLPPGRIRMRYVIETDGVVQPGSIRVLEVQGADYARQAQAHVSTCRFAPARVRGQPAAVIVESLESFGR